MAETLVYSFSNEMADGDSTMVDVLGGKGANLAQMCNLKLPVPPGFTISSLACKNYYSSKQTLSKTLFSDAYLALQKIEKQLGVKFGDHENPLLLSVRSGSKVSMPGMMDTILNLGLNDVTVAGLAIKTNNSRFAYDCYRRFIQMYADVVLNIEYYKFDEILDTYRRAAKITEDRFLSTQDLEEIIVEFKKIVREHTKKDFPQDVYEQLNQAIVAVFDSWMSARAITYRKIHNIPEDLGTAVNIQSMVFGNTGDNSGTGVLFTRNPSTGEKALYGEYLINAQGEDVVAGIRTPEDISSLNNAMPDVYGQLADTAAFLEKYYRDVQDIEFTIQDRKLWILQTRAAKRTINAALKIAIDLVEESVISKQEALMRIPLESLDKLLHPTIDKNAKKSLFACGLAASPGAASGVVVFNASDAESQGALGAKVILVRNETSPEDIAGMNAAEGILTARGGMTSHAAVVARGMGKPCIVGAYTIKIDMAAGAMYINGKTVNAGDYITLDGCLGEVYLGVVPTTQNALPETFHTVMKWADEFKTLKIRTNAETIMDIKAAITFGAEGIGLCRTEHMFFEASRIISVRKMILSSTRDERITALSELLPMQRSDFIQILSLMGARPVNIRLLDMPLHEFLPKKDDEIAAVAKSSGIAVSEIHLRIKQLDETNPMLGHRGCRLAITYPEIYQMQARAIFEAMIEVKGANVEVMVPLIASDSEMRYLRELIESVASEVETKHKMKLKYKIGTMIELPRAALNSDKIAKYAEYFSYGTNDLTQTTFGLSRDDASFFANDYIQNGIFNFDPFSELDVDGVGELIKISAAKGRAARPGITLSVCGEIGGDPKSIKFFSDLNFAYISCSPYRIPTAKLAAAQAAISSQALKKRAKGVEKVLAVV